MKDRIPKKPGRVLITPEDGSPAYYATMMMADEPTEEGTPLNKGTLLSDATAAAYGMSKNTATPDALFRLIRPSFTEFAYGRYDGEGTSGVDAKNALFFNFVPSLVIVIDAKPETSDGGFIWFTGMKTGGRLSDKQYWSTANPILNFLNSNNVLYWWTTNSQGQSVNNPEYQMNKLGKTYYWFALGKRDF